MLNEPIKAWNAPIVTFSLIGYNIFVFKVHPPRRFSPPLKQPCKKSKKLSHTKSFVVATMHAVF